MDTWKCVTEFLHCWPETITTLLISYMPIQNKKTNYQTIQTSFPLDSFQYKDEIIDEPQSFIERIKAFFNIEKTSTQKANSLTSEAAYDKASLVLSEALLNKKELTWLIFKGVQNDYEDIYNHAGNLVTFAQDHLGRGVMTEHDQKDKPIRITTFALSVFCLEKFYFVHPKLCL